MTPTPVTAREAKAKLDRGDRIVFVDARNPQAWGAANVKLPGAIRVPIDAVEEYVSELPRDGTIVTYCT